MSASIHKCHRCGTELKVLTVKVPIYRQDLSPDAPQVEQTISHYEDRDDVADCARCTGGY